MTDALTPEAKAEIKAAIQIIREDRFEQYVRTRTAKPADAPKNDPPTDPPVDPPKVDGPTPPPPKVDDPPVDPPAPKKGIWWNEIPE